MARAAFATIYTLGHSRHPIELFLSLLAGQGIRRVVDTRGTPFSRFNPQFNRERLRASLHAENIDYQWRGEHLSGRPRDRRFYGPGGEVLWNRLRDWPALHAALDEVVADAAKVSTALICAEEDPKRCHRRFLLAPLLQARGAEVLHIRKDGSVQGDGDIAGPSRNRAQPDLFR